MLCYNTADVVRDQAMSHHALETTLNWSAWRRLAIAGFGVLLLWSAVWWAIQ
jgi:hypothetical protein